MADIFHSILNCDHASHVHTSPIVVGPIVVGPLPFDLGARYNVPTAWIMPRRHQRMRTLSVSLMGGFLGMAAMAASSNITFNKDVLPVLQKNCQECHRPGEVAPMSLLTYSEARPWAKALKAAGVTQKMPPWFADPKYGHFANDRRLSPEEVEIISAWADNGAPEGDAKDKPAAKTFPTGWKIKPDMVIEMPEAFVIPAKR